MLQKWKISNINSEEAKVARERDVPSFKSKNSPITVPENNSSYKKLKKTKKSRASQANIEPEDKPWHQLRYKNADFGIPLLYLTRHVVIEHSVKPQ
jgi:hypothetical protein